MGWSIGWDETWGRDIGYGVPAYCDQPGCDKEIHRGLSYVCGGDAYGGDRGCGLFFCSDHLHHAERLPMQLCHRCLPRRKAPYTPKPEHPTWMRHVLKDKSWAQWRKENPDKVAEFKSVLSKYRHSGLEPA